MKTIVCIFVVFVALVSFSVYVQGQNNLRLDPGITMMSVWKRSAATSGDTRVTVGADTRTTIGADTRTIP